MPTRKLMAAAAFVSVVTFLAGGAAATGRPVMMRHGFTADSDSAVQISPTMIEAGRKIFHGDGGCFACHGPDLGGTAIAPDLKDSKWKNGDGSLADIVKIVSEGVPGTLMVSHPGGISDEQLRNVTAYVWAVSHGKAKP